jgi:uncharacterized membrane protein YebE (DUF533 family)
MKRLTIRVKACTDTLSLMIAMAWADGRLDDREKQGVRGAAEVFNLPKELRAELDAALEKSPDVAGLALEELSSGERAFAYVAAAWMSGVDRLADTKERALLDRLAERLKIEGDRRTELEKVASSLEPPVGAKPQWASEVERLFKAIPREVDDSDEDVEVVFE